MAWACSQDIGNTTKGKVDVSFPLLLLNQSKPDLEGGEEVHLLVCVWRGGGSWSHFKGYKCKEGIVCRCLKSFCVVIMEYLRLDNL